MVTCDLFKRTYTKTLPATVNSILKAISHAFVKSCSFIIIIYTLIQASEEPHGSYTRKGWLLLLFAMAPWERLKFILVMHLLNSPEKTQKTRDITNSRAGESMCTRYYLILHIYVITLLVADIPPRQKYHVDPTMIGILVAMFLMFITICVVLRLFSKARWRENRTIFNTPNPRLMNASLLKENKHLHDRRGSRTSRGISRQPSIVSLRPQSPASQGNITFC
ncbi:hypothetical protein NQ317_012859 [Molorchus minor]|uniref:Uncharacterized protein n=1 Tax=Molorchus minor TaxID=1323400 RepID=A0ABQ9IUB7_9CUCU|nr:hypothetical protein NQ317_012859 [Molorchus minor]